MRYGNLLTIAFFIAIAVLILVTPVSGFAATDNPGGTAAPNSGGAGSGSSVEKEEKFFEGLKNFYLLGLSLVGISALLMIVWGGIDYVVAGDSTSRVEAGRKKITNALWGVFIAGISYALLYTINPDLVKFRIGTVQDYRSQNK